MNYYVALPFVAVLVNVVFTTYIFAQNRKNPVNEAYILLSVFLICWMMFDIIHWSPIDPELVMPLLRLQSFFWLLIGFMFTNFTYTFLERDKDLAYYLTLLAAAVAVPIGMTSDLVLAGHQRMYWGTAIIGGPLYVPMVNMVVLVPFLYSLFLFFQRMLRPTDAIERNQCLLILVGTGVAVLITYATMIVLPQAFGFRPPPLTHIGILIHICFIFYAIVKYKFLAVGIREAAQDIFSTVREGVVILNKQGGVMQINDSARQTLGIASDELPDQPVHELLDASQDAQGKERSETIIEQDSGSKTLRVSRSPLIQGGREVGSIVFIRDITQQKHAEYEVQRINSDLALARDEALAASKAKSQFLANMSHELRTPLNAIIGYSEMLREEALDSGDRDLQTDLEKIHGAGHHLLTLINDILDISKIEAGRMELYPETFSVQTLINEVVATIKPLMEKNHNTLSIQGAEAAGEITTDLTKLRQALLNLLSNAAKFTDHGEVFVEVGRDPGEAGKIRFRVTDTGIGMSPEQVKGLFRYFSQADPSTTRKYGGTGLGLAISRRYCELMDGRIEVKSVPGKGSSFSIELPVRAAWVDNARTGEAPVSEPKTEEKEPAGHDSPRKILVVDDDPSVRELLGRYLDREGFRVVLADNGQQGLELAGSEQPDMIILDVMMPQLDGWDVLNRLKANARLSGIPVIMLSMVDDKSKGYALGAVQFLNKPIDWEQLGDAVHDVSQQIGKPHPQVLVVEDEAATRTMVRRLIEKQHWSVTEAANGHEALKRIQEQKPSLIVLDLMMPEMDGFELIDIVRKDPELNTIPIIVLTAMQLTERDRTRLAGQVNNILLKGAYETEKLLQQIRELIAGQAVPVQSR